MSLKLNPITGKLDLTNGTAVNRSGGTMTGDLVFPATGFVMDCGTAKFRVTVNCSGSLVVTPISTGPLGISLGLANM